MLVWKDKHLLLIERKKFPFGFAPPAGHVDDGEDFKKAAIRELWEEVGLKAKSIRLIIEGRKENKCRRENGNWHYWKIYKVVADGVLKGNEEETKKSGFLNKEEVEKLMQKTEKYFNGEISEEEWEKLPGLETAWYEWFKELRLWQ